jgi:hypothetical protein
MIKPVRFSSAKKKTRSKVPKTGGKENQELTRFCGGKIPECGGAGAPKNSFLSVQRLRKIRRAR